ncbi:hypothetical protein TraAM80_08273 [Trypanosoma rangeli]|uniref:Uncharacterized protein n=1 Tax=Trypanosoma rangeli TaxID=5698 RepID=A0A422N1D9_TRYRA|nr:uncharacterized protein TraAM80_08273 [Trypanosoma rangeli]RNE99275.1 hypothetical protein TraAM80_08273 [Trypanosoma rangeli]|eukprot:RNE99275.1 hypothetical protein TraAM80_08273 [Trypanosoma rangeli]
MIQTTSTRQDSKENDSSPDVVAQLSKAVSFHPSAAHQTTRGLNSKNYSYFSESAWESRESNSGYYQEQHADADEGIRHGLYQRLYRFYKVYNPQKIDRIEEYLTAYKGKEELLIATLTGKYGPEPPDTAPQLMSSTCSSENASIMHDGGKRYTFPACVSPQQGNTDCKTPYWGNFNLIGERDVLGLLCNLDTTNEELQKCYIGILAQHPSSSWNGMTYITRAREVASGGTSFLGHIWAGSLSSQKTLVHEGAVYQRADLYCTEECQRSGPHERWKLSIYSSEVNSLHLFRVVWDPVIFLEPLPFSRSAASLHSSFEQGSLMGSSASRFHFCSEGAEQPRQPSVSGILMGIMKSLERIERNFWTRLDALDAKMSLLESRLSSRETASQNNANS